MAPPGSIGVLALLLLLGPGRPDAATAGDRAITSRDLEIAFDRDRLQPREIRHRGRGTSLAAWRDGPSLFAIELRADGGRGAPLHPERLADDYVAPSTRSVTVDERMRCGGRVARALDAPYSGLGLYFTGCDVGDERGVLDVTVRAVASPDEDGIAWDLELENRSERWGVWIVRFPIVRLIPPGRSPADDLLVYPRGLGRSVPNPYSEASRRRHRFGWRRLGYPEQMNMPWTALLDPGRGGLYIGAHDRRAAHKRFHWETSSDGVTVAVEHLPPDMGVAGRRLERLAPIVMRWSPGHWWDAAQIHREWVLGARSVPLQMRRKVSVPDWYRAAPIALVLWQQRRKVSEVTKSARAYARFFAPSSPLPLFWYHWSELRPDDTSTERIVAGTHAGYPFPAHRGFGRAVEQLESVGLRVQPYVNARVTDAPGGAAEVRAELRPLLVEDVNGRPRLWSPDWPGLLDTCRQPTAVHSRLMETMKGIANAYGVVGAYLDQFGTLQNACFGEHGHPRGGGDWQVRAIHRMAQAIRDYAGGEFVVTDENGADTFVGVRGGSLLNHDAWPGAVPLVPAVYGGRWIQIGNNLSRHLDDPVALRVVLGEQLVNGLKLGRVDVTTERWLEPATIDGMRLIRDVARWRRAAAPWLDDGRLLRPAALDAAVADVTIGGGTDRARTRVPGVQSGVWEATDGSVALLLFNVTGRAVEFALTHAALGGGVRLSDRSLDGEERPLAKDARRGATVVLSLAADEVRLLVARPAAVGD